MKKKNISVICAVAGVCVLSSAALASYRTANGYDTLKKSLLSSLDYENCTLTGTLMTSFDGQELMTVTSGLEADYPNGRSHDYSITTSPISLDGTDEYRTESYTDGGYYYYMHYLPSEDGEISETDGFWRGMYSEPQKNLWGIDDADRGTADKIVRFMELAADTVVGDLRNNFVCTEDADDYTAYSIDLDSVQIPEIVNAGLSMAFSMANSHPTYTVYDEDGNESEVAWDETDLEYYILKLGSDPVVDRLSLDFAAGEEGNFRDGLMTVIFKGEDADGNEHIMTFDVSLTFSDIGTTSVTPVTELGVALYEYDDNGNEIRIN